MAEQIAPQELQQIGRFLQTFLSSRIKVEPCPEPHFIAAVDAAYNSTLRLTIAGAVVYTYPSLIPVEQAVSEPLPIPFPYVPGLLAFRELPAVLQALRNLCTPFQLVLCEGQGIAHPRRFGMACHLGLILDKPTIGVAKKPLIGKYAPFAARRGAWAPLVDKGVTVGAALCTRLKVKPVVVSIGHKITLNQALKVVQNCAVNYRMPEPLRHAHQIARKQLNYLVNNTLGNTPLTTSN